MENDGRKDCSGSVERIICDTPGDREIKKQDERQLWGNKIVLCGSYTVEAAVVCPMIFLVIVLIWYLGAFWHNQIVCQAVCQEAVYAGMKAKWEGKDEAAAMQRVLSEQSSYLFLADQVQGWQKVQGNQLKASMTAEMRFPLRFLPGMNTESWKISEQAELQTEHPVTAIRKMRRLQRWKEWK